MDILFKGKQPDHLILRMNDGTCLSDFEKICDIYIY